MHIKFCILKFLLFGIGKFSGMSGERFVKIVINLPNGESSILEFICKSEEAIFFPMFNMRYKINEIFDGPYKSYVLKKERSNTKFILDPTAMPIIKEDGNYALSQFGVEVCTLFKSMPTVFYLIPRGNFDNIPSYLFLSI